MRKKKLVSIIIPVYNSEKFLERTLKSVLSQTYGKIEVLLIDDGSTDGSGDICDRYQDMDFRVRVFHRENRGVSAARNLGILHMKGEFCQFVDSDDVIPENYTEVLTEKLEQSGCDVAFCGVAKTVQGVTYSFALDDEVLSVDEYLYELYRGEKFVTKSACIGLYRADIIKKGKIGFPKHISCGEDSVFVMRYIKHCRSVRAVDDTIYHYRYDNSNSATRVLYYDHFLVEMERYELARELIKKDDVKRAVAQFYMDQEIRELVWYISLSQEKYRTKICTLKKFVRNKGNGYAIRFYRRDDRKKSWIIPVMIRMRAAIPLYLALRHRSVALGNGSLGEKKVQSAYR